MTKTQVFITGFHTLWGNSRAVLRENSRAVLGPYATAMLMSPNARATGGSVIGGKPLSARAWLRMAAARMDGKAHAILYKRVDAGTFATQKGIAYKPGDAVVAPDWDAASQQECGAGLHFCASPGATKQFRVDGVFVACRVAIKDMAALPAFAIYPDKIRARACTVLYVCDEEGNEVKANQEGK